MTGQLTSIYQETIHAQTALIRLAELQSAGVPSPADWNAAEDCLDAALERFRTYRLEVAPPSASNWRSPGLAGGQGGSGRAVAATDPLPAFSNAAAGLSEKTSNHTAIS